MDAAAPSGTILIEGWRFVPHSYAIVNQWQCLELLRRGNRLAMHDLPYFRKAWKPIRGLHDDPTEALLARIPPLPEGERAQSVLRISVPARLQPSPHGPTTVFCAADCGWMPRAAIENRMPLKQAHAGTDVRLITPSRWSHWGLLRSGADPERVSIVPHGVDTSLFRPASADERAEIRRELGWSGKFVFLNVSAMTGNKGIIMLLQAFAGAARANGDAVLVLKGLDDLYQSVKSVRQKLAQLGGEVENASRGRIQCIGRSLTFGVLAQLYRGADVYVSPYHSESFNLPVLEAVASGLPVICTAGGPTDDFTTPEVAHRIESKIVARKGGAHRDQEEVVLTPNYRHLKTLMRRVMEDRALAASARSHGPALVQANFTWGHAVDRLLAALHR